MDIPTTASALLAQLAAAMPLDALDELEAELPALNYDTATAPSPAESSWLEYTDSAPADPNQALADYCWHSSQPPVPLTAEQQAAIIAGLARALAARQLAEERAARAAEDRALLRQLLAKPLTPPAPLPACDPFGPFRRFDSRPRHDPGRGWWA